MMERKNITTYYLREQCGIDSKTIRRLKANENTETKTLNKICSALDCKLEDIAEYIPDWENANVRTVVVGTHIFYEFTAAPVRCGCRQ